MTDRGDTGCFRVGDLEVDVGRREVRRGPERLDLPKLSFRLLLALVDRAPRVVSHDELVDTVWSGRVVSAETVTQRVKLVRQAIGDDADDPRYIGLVRGEGYRLLADVESIPADEGRVSRRLVGELGRRRVLQVALIYAAVAWSVTEVLAFLLEALPVFPVWSQTLIAILFVVGFPVTMLLAWRFDIGPDGIERTVASSAEGRVTIVAAILLLVGATGGLFYLIYPQVEERVAVDAPPVRPTVEGTTIAVMPFVNATGDPDDIYISEGMSDELRDQLGQVPGLRVAARSSSVVFRDDMADAVTVAERLGVTKLVEGSMRRQGDELRVTIQIIDGATGFQDWTDSYSRSTRDLLAVQQDIASAVVTRVLPELDPTLVPAQPPTMDATAHELMLLARHHFQQVRESPIVDIGVMMRVIDLYSQAIALDPESALAQSRLAEAYLYIGDMDAAEDPIFRAMSIDPDLSEVQNTLGLYYWRRFLPGSGEAHKRAVELNPNSADALEKYGKWLWHQQFTDDVEPYFLRALELDPMSLSRYLDLGHFYGISNRRGEALDVIEEIRSRFSDANAYMAIARLYELTGDLDEAIAWALKARALEPDDPEKSWQVAELYARIGDFEGAHVFQHRESPFDILFWERRYDEMIELGEELVFEPVVEIQVWYGLARAYVATGQFETAAYVLQRQGLPGIAQVDARRANGMEALVTLADALLNSGEIDRARELAEWAAAKFSQLAATGAGDSWWPNLYEACLLSMLDDDNAALETLARVNNSIGLLWYPVLMDAPCFRKFADEPVYRDVVSRYEQRLAALRERLPDTLARHQTIR